MRLNRNEVEAFPTPHGTLPQCSPHPTRPRDQSALPFADNMEHGLRDDLHSVTSHQRPAHPLVGGVFSRTPSISPSAIRRGTTDKALPLRPAFRSRSRRAIVLGSPMVPTPASDVSSIWPWARYHHGWLGLARFSCACLKGATGLRVPNPRSEIVGRRRSSLACLGSRLHPVDPTFQLTTAD